MDPTDPFDAGTWEREHEGPDSGEFSFQVPGAAGLSE